MVWLCAQVELTELSSEAWQGSLGVGLVAKLPSSLPNSIAELDEGSWCFAGSSLVGHSSAAVGQTDWGEHYKYKVNI